MMLEGKRRWINSEGDFHSLCLFALLRYSMKWVMSTHISESHLLFSVYGKTQSDLCPSLADRLLPTIQKNEGSSCFLFVLLFKIKI